MMKKKTTLFLLVLLLAMNVPAYGWFFTKTDAEQLQQALKSQDSEEVAECLERQIEIRNYIGVLRLKQHALRMMQKQRGLINGKPGSTSLDLVREIKPWQKIVARADASSKKNIRRDVLQSQQDIKN